MARRKHARESAIAAVPAGETSSVTPPTAHGSLSKKTFDHMPPYLQATPASGTLAIWPTRAGHGGPDRVRLSRVSYRHAPLEPAKSRYSGADAAFGRADATVRLYEGKDLLGEGSRRAEPSECTRDARGLRATRAETLVDRSRARPRGPLRIPRGRALEALELKSAGQA